MMHARAWWLAAALAVAVGTAAADPKPTPVDIKPYRDKLLVLRDADGGTYVISSCYKFTPHLYYGTGKTLYQQIIVERGRNGPTWEVGVWAPRLGNYHPGTVEYRKDGKYWRFCGNHKTPLTRLTGAAAANVLDHWKFMSPALVRRAHLLARDDRGVYYYVDRLDKAHGRKGFRVFVGKKGAMKQLPLQDIANDSGGEVFSTRSGELRLVRSSDPLTISWIHHGRHHKLLMLPRRANSKLIYGDLGVYRFIGTMCASD